MLDTHIDTPTASATAAVCDSIALYGASPERGELDSREVWDEDDATEALGEAIRVIVDGVTVEGTQLADEREALLWGFVNTLHSQVGRLDRIVPDMRDLEKAQDGTEVKAWELQLLTDRAHNLGDRRDAFEKMRDLAADAYRVETGDVWRPRHGSHASQTGRLTSAAIDARDFRRARKDRESQAHLPEGTLVAITGGKNVADADAVWTTLDRTREKYGDMILLHGGGPGIEKIAASWAEARGGRPGGVPPELERAREGRALQAERRASEPSAEGRHRGFPAPGSPGTWSTRPASSASRSTPSPREGGAPATRQGRSFASARDRPPFCAVPGVALRGAAPVPRTARRGLASSSALSRRRRTLAAPPSPATAPPYSARPLAVLRTAYRRRASRSPSRRRTDFPSSRSRIRRRHHPIPCRFIRGSRDPFSVPGISHPGECRLDIAGRSDVKI